MVKEAQAGNIYTVISTQLMIWWVGRFRRACRLEGRLTHRFRKAQDLEPRRTQSNGDENSARESRPLLEKREKLRTHGLIQSTSGRNTRYASDTWEPPIPPTIVPASAEDPNHPPLQEAQGWGSLGCQRVS